MPQDGEGIPVDKQLDVLPSWQTSPCRGSGLTMEARRGSAATRPFRRTRRSVMAGRSPWSPTTARSTGSRYLSSTPRAYSERCSTASAADASRSHRSCPTGSNAATCRDTNVLETVFTTAGGSVRVTDAMTVPASGLGPLREVSRRVEGIAGTCRWRGASNRASGTPTARPDFDWRGGVPVASSGGDALAVRSFSAGTPSSATERSADGSRRAKGRRRCVAICASHHEPLVFPARDELESRLDATATTWRRVERRPELLRSLARRRDPKRVGAQAAGLRSLRGARRRGNDLAPRGARRGAQLGLPLLLGPGCGVHPQRSARASCAPEARAYFWWLMHASQLTHPQLRVLYRLDGGADAPERDLPLEGYRGSRPVRAGNAAASQLQLDTYGELLQTPHGCSRRQVTGSTATSHGAWRRWPTSSAGSGGSPTRGSGRCAARTGISPSRR